MNRNDVEMSLFSGTGAGGQNRNKCQKCVRLLHIPTGIMVIGQRQRSLEDNKRQAFAELERRIDALNAVEPERIETVIPVQAVARRISDKRANAFKKADRRVSME